jgi:hypothetical protein
MPPFLTLGTVKGLLLRHLRWWSKHPDIFHVDGTLNIGYAYPNMYMCEDYNSPQSPYWCLKTLISISLPEDHEFWSCEELPHPMARRLSSSSPVEKASPDRLSVAGLEEPKQILVSSPNHHYLLSLGQFCPWPIKASEAKYCKIAYSSAFGFSVPTGPLIQQMAPDNTIAISEDEGETWRLMWKSSNPQLGSVQFQGSDGKLEPVPKLIATWSPGKKSPLLIETTIIAPTQRWPDWHLRVHRIRRRSGASRAAHAFKTVEGGFAAPCRRLDGSPLPLLTTAHFENDQRNIIEGVVEDGPSSLITSFVGASGLVQLSPASGKGEALKPDSNTNLMFQRSFIPTIKQEHTFSENEEEIKVVVGVFAISREHVSLSGHDIWNLWNDRPVVKVSGRSHSTEDVIIIVQ